MSALADQLQNVIKQIQENEAHKIDATGLMEAAVADMAILGASLSTLLLFLTLKPAPIRGEVVVEAQRIAGQLSELLADLATAELKTVQAPGSPPHIAPGSPELN